MQRPPPVTGAPSASSSLTPDPRRKPLTDRNGRAAPLAKPPSTASLPGASPGASLGALPAASPTALPPAASTAAAEASPAQASAAERTPEYSFADAEGGGLVLRVEMPELTSMEAVELDVSCTSFSLYVPQLYQLGPIAWPRAVDADAAVAKFKKKSGVLQVTLPGM